MFKYHPFLLAAALGVLVAVQGCQLPRPSLFEHSETGTTGEGRTVAIVIEAPQTQTAAQVETFVHKRINAIRKQNGAGALKRNGRLDAVARAYSRQMAEGNFFSHTSPDGTSVADRVRRAGVLYMVVGENLAKIGGSNRPAQIAVEGWMKSPGHRENILRKVFSESGVGAWRQGRLVYITQVFLRPVGF